MYLAIRGYNLCGMIIKYNNRTQRRHSRFFTISSQRRKLSPTRMLKWPKRNRVQIMQNTSSAYHAQVTCMHVACHLVRRDSSAIKFDRVELKSHLFQLYFIGWTTKPTKEGRKPEYPEKTPGDELQKMMLYRTLRDKEWGEKKHKSANPVQHKSWLIKFHDFDKKNCIIFYIKGWLKPEHFTSKQLIVCLFVLFSALVSVNVNYIQVILKAWLMLLKRIKNNTKICQSVKKIYRSTKSIINK